MPHRFVRARCSPAHSRGILEAVAAEGFEPSRSRLCAASPAAGRCVGAGAVLHRPGRAHETRLGARWTLPAARLLGVEPRQLGSKPCGRVRRHKRQIVVMATIDSLEPGSRTRRSRYRKPKPASGGSSRRASLLGVEPSLSGLEDPRREPPGRALIGEPDRNRTDPRRVAADADRLVTGSRSGQRVTLPPCLSGTQASSLSDWPHRERAT